MSIGAFIIARLSSSRLPEKNILEIMGKSMIEKMAERVKAAERVDKVIITTSDQSSDDQLESVSKKNGVGCYRGSLDNIMDRIIKASETYECDTIVELLGDNPLVHSALIDDVVEFFLEGKYDYAATVTREYPVSCSEYKLFPIGVRVQVYSIDAAERYKDYSEYINNKHKHPCSYIFEHPESFRIGYFEAKDKWAFLSRPNLNFAVNYQENLDMIRKIFELCYPQNSNFSMREIIRTINENPDLGSLMGTPS